ncbi:MAG: PHP domain-containing protein [Longimicrobiales bacterium]|nr:PHP domain-containing protein [Longimicrobiales bacterium]
MRLDLHIHTTASDGAWTPEKVVEGAVRGGLDVIAIADHDTTAAVWAAQASGATRNVQVIPALEMSSTWVGREIHVLGYFVDPESPALVAHERRALRLREERMKEMLSRLAGQGIEVAYESVESAAGPDRVNLGRPHLARALVAGGHATSVPDAFNTLIGDQHPAFVPTRLLEPTEAVALILEGGGLPVWAHPPADVLDSLLPGLVRSGLRGLEVYRPSHSRNDVIRLEGVCRTTGLVMSGGSDWHSPDSGAALGSFHVTADEVEKLLVAGGM